MKKIASLMLCILFIPTVIFADGGYEPDNLASYGATSCEYAIFKDNECIAKSENQTSLPIGSVSKTFTAAAVMQLCEEGKLELDAPAYTYLKGFTMQDERYKNITVRMLLNHTSGLYGSTMKNSMLYKDNDTWNHDNFLSLLSEQRLKCEPGKMVNYCNDGFSLLELIIEEVSKISYSEFLNNHISKPLGLKNTVTALEYNGDCTDFVNALGAGGIFSTPEELCKFGYSVMKNDKMLESTKTEYTPVTLNCGLGWDDTEVYPFDKWGVKAVAKNGDTNSHHSSLLILPEYGISAAIMTEGASSVICQTAAVKMVMKYLSDNGTKVEYPDETLKEKNVSDIDEYKKYEGYYICNAEQYQFSIRSGIGFLRGLYAGTEQPLVYMGEGRFAQGTTVITFEEHDGKEYIYASGVADVGTLGKYRSREYLGKKVSQGGELSEAWQKRNGKVYLLCDEKYDSQLYMKTISTARVYVTPELPAYMAYTKIKDDNSSVADVAIPGNGGRDFIDCDFYTENGAEYLNAQGWTYIDISAIPAIYPGEASLCTIQKNGFARWYMAGSAAGKKISVTHSGEGAYTIYGANGMAVYSSAASIGEAEIPLGGYIVFAGDIGTVFNITLK